MVLSELGSGVPLADLAELLSKLSKAPDQIRVMDESGQVVATFGPPVQAVVVNDGTHPSSKRVTVKGECRCGQVLARYTGGLRLTATTRGGVPGILRGPDGVFVTNCRRRLSEGASTGWQICKVPANRWPYDELATALRDAWDRGERRFVLT